MRECDQGEKYFHQVHYPSAETYFLFSYVFLLRVCVCVNNVSNDGLKRHPKYSHFIFDPVDKLI